MTQDGILHHHGSYVEWGAVFAGAAVACAFSTTMLQFGSVVGLSESVVGNVFNQPETEPAVADWSMARLLGAGVWMLLIQIFASIGGGYLAGRMRSPVEGATLHEREVRDGIHGLLTWATATLAVMAGAAIVGGFAAIAASQTGDLQETVLTDAQQNATVIFGFIAGTAAIVSAAASWVASVIGGEHRDSRTDFTHCITFRK